MLAVLFVASLDIMLPFAPNEPIRGILKLLIYALGVKKEDIEQKIVNPKLMSRATHFPHRWETG